MDIFIEEKEDIIIVFLSGVLSYDSIKEFDDITEEQVRKKPELLALNCSDLDHVDSYGLHHLFELTKKASKEDVKIIAFGLNPSVNDIMEVTNLNTIIMVISEEDFKKNYLHPDE